MARTGVGIAVVSTLGASHRDAADLRLLPPRPTVQREVFVIRQRDRAPSEREPARALMDALVIYSRRVACADAPLGEVWEVSRCEWRPWGAWGAGWVCSPGLESTPCCPPAITLE